MTKPIDVNIIVSNLAVSAAMVRELEKTIKANLEKIMPSHTILPLEEQVKLDLKKKMNDELAAHHRASPFPPHERFPFGTMSHIAAMNIADHPEIFPRETVHNAIRVLRDHILRGQHIHDEAAAERRQNIARDRESRQDLALQDLKTELANLRNRLSVVEGRV